MLVELEGLAQQRRPREGPLVIRNEISCARERRLLKRKLAHCYLIQFDQRNGIAGQCGA